MAHVAMHVRRLSLKQHRSETPSRTRSKRLHIGEEDSRPMGRERVQNGPIVLAIDNTTTDTLTTTFEAL